jgi:uncharacterized heparinase superfamily protein
LTTLGELRPLRPLATLERSRAVRAIRRIGPRPLLLARYLGHHALTRWQQRSLRITYASRVANPPEGADLQLPAIDLPSARALSGVLADAAATIRAEAELILQHRVDLLGSGLVELGDDIQWNLDFKSGYRWPPSFYQDVEVTRLTDASDAKVPWELSRCHHLLTLARAAVLFEDSDYAEELERELESWLADNPTGYGINWANPMEVALRAVNWVWAIATLETWRKLDPALRPRVTASLQSHGRHLAANLEGTPYLRSNHYLSNLLGLLVLGTSLENDPEAERWRRLAASALEKEIRTQVLADGVGFEASLPYHGLALEIFLLATMVARDAGIDLSPGFTARLERMLEASRALRHSNGRLPLFGDGDSGRVLPGSFEHRPTLDHLLWLGAALFEQSRPLSGMPDPEVAWTIGATAWQRLARAPESAAPTESTFPASGFYILRGSRLRVFVRCGDVGQNGNGGHAHNDLFSFELSYGDVPIVVDSGTYTYTADPAARNAFRSTCAHNTVAVAGAEINPIIEDELFRLRQVARPRVELWRDFDQAQLVVTHDGYRRLHPPVTHRRSFVLEPSIDTFEVRDELLGRGDQDAHSFLHLAADTQVTRIGECEFALSRDHETVTLAFRDTAEVRLVDGWVSDRYGVRKRAAVLVARVSGSLPLAFGYQFSLAGDPEIVRPLATASS